MRRQRLLRISQTPQINRTVLIIHPQREQTLDAEVGDVYSKQAGREPDSPPVQVYGLDGVYNALIVRQRLVSG
jgi:hypothetical protein